MDKPNLRVVKAEHTLVYGMRLLPNERLEEQDHQQVTVELPDGESLPITLHQIVGDKEEIKRRLAESVDAFFEIYGEDLG